MCITRVYTGLQVSGTSQQQFQFKEIAMPTAKVPWNGHVGTKTRDTPCASRGPHRVRSVYSIAAAGLA
ncbi:hypothetical protein Y032_0004g2061 [Ancylostoma ceylanicum]|uniref:Uncharacterized protein n=1 Tax=Ancylostoma ceylanicum TaxID=53326 RepID=A0A016VWW4_9BILA|nr:hypothetical protein Y032_0004g2061 [Ancylostoma ceylanicum]